MIRTFDVHVDKAELLSCLSYKLDMKLENLEKQGWKIISVNKYEEKTWDCSKQEYFNNIGFIIIANFEKEHEDE